MQSEPFLNNLLDDEFLFSSLSPEDVEIWKEIAGSCKLWNLKMIKVYEAQEKTKGKDVKIAIIDSGIEYTHPELSLRFYENKGWDFVNNNDLPLDPNGHGTHIAGIIAGQNMGIAPMSMLYAFRVMDDEMKISHTRINKAIKSAINYGVDIINISISAPKYDKEIEFLCRTAHEEGIVVIASAGNNFSGAGFPASYGENVISVVSVDNNMDRAVTSNIWSTNDISAPGVNIFSCYKDGGYSLSSGTSMAAAHVTGIVALGISLLKEKGIKIKPDELEGVLKSTSKRLSRGVKKEASRYRLSKDLSAEQSIRWFYGEGIILADRFLEKINNI